MHKTQLTLEMTLQLSNRKGSFKAYSFILSVYFQFLSKSQFYPLEMSTFHLTQ